VDGVGLEDRVERTYRSNFCFQDKNPQVTIFKCFEIFFFPVVENMGVFHNKTSDNKG
jgi:hypothetical protein